METIQSFLIQAAGQQGILISQKQADCFQRYMELLLEWNQKMNLTAITEPEEVAIKHFVDSLLLFKAVVIPEHAKVADVGTGAGFPGIPLAVMRPDLDLTLLDSLNKRLVFLEAVCNGLEISSTRVHMRAEEAGRQKAFREQFDLVTARAVAPLNLLAEYCLPLVKVGGIFAAMKGPGIEEELAVAKQAVSILGGKLEEVCSFLLPDGSKRSIAVIKKIKHTGDRYPRQSAKIAKNPL